MGELLFNRTLHSQIYTRLWTIVSYDPCGGSPHSSWISLLLTPPSSQFVCWVSILKRLNHVGKPSNLAHGTNWQNEVATPNFLELTFSILNPIRSKVSGVPRGTSVVTGEWYKAHTIIIILQESGIILQLLLKFHSKIHKHSIQSLRPPITKAGIQAKTWWHTSCPDPWP